MSNATYNALWAEAVGELTEQAHLEDPSLIDGAEPVEPHRPTSIMQTFQHLACLYIKRVLRRSFPRRGGGGAGGGAVAPFCLRAWARWCPVSSR